MIRSFFIFLSIASLIACGNSNDKTSIQTSQETQIEIQESSKNVKTVEPYEIDGNLEEKYYQIDVELKSIDVDPLRIDIADKMSGLDKKIKTVIDKDKNLELRLERQKLREKLSGLDRKSGRDSLLKIKNYLVRQLN